MLNLKSGQKVLDVGCGIGGGDFYMAKVRGKKPGPRPEMYKRNWKDLGDWTLTACFRVLEWKCWAWTCQKTWWTSPWTGPSVRSCHQWVSSSPHSFSSLKSTVKAIHSLQCALHQVQFEVADATRRTFPEGSFDVIYSRDTILHIDDKLELFKRFHVRLFSHFLHFTLACLPVDPSVIVYLLIPTCWIPIHPLFPLPCPVVVKARWPVAD